MNKSAKKLFQIIFSLIFWIGVWALLSFKVNNAFILPTPKDIFGAIIDLISSTEFWLITLQSIGRIILGIVLAFAVGIVLAIITVSFSFLDFLVSPMISAIKATPVASFIFIAIIFMNRNFLPVFITALLVIPIVWTNVAAGIKSVPKELKEVSKIYSFSLKKRLTKLYFPSIMPYFIASCRSSLGMAWKAGVAAGVLCTPTAAIGTKLYFAKTYLETQNLFAWTLIIIILSLIIERLIIYLISKLSANRPNIVRRGDIE